MKASGFIKNVLKTIVLSVVLAVVFILWLCVGEWIKEPESEFYNLGVIIYTLVGFFSICFFVKFFSEVQKKSR